MRSFNSMYHCVSTLAKKHIITSVGLSSVYRRGGGGGHQICGGCDLKFQHFIAMRERESKLKEPWKFFFKQDRCL